jgi:hypothetical protein
MFNWGKNLKTNGGPWHLKNGARKTTLKYLVTHPLKGEI